MTAHALVTRRLLLRDMGRAGLAIIIFGTSACSADPSSNASRTEEPDETTSSAVFSSELAPHKGEVRAWKRVDLGFVSAYILYRDGEAAIVDTGVGGSEGDIEAALREVGLGWDAVGSLLVTHLHDDHQGSLSAVIDATTDVLPWFAGADDMAGIEAPTEDHAVDDGDVVDHGLQIISTPGHTSGHISVLDPIAGILVAGDSLSGSNGGVGGANQDFTDDMTLANASVVKLAAFDYEVALFGHGEPVVKGASGLVAELAESLNGG